MKEPFERRVEGTYKSADEAKEAVQRLLDEGYQTREILLITDEDSSHQKDLKRLTQVDVDSVDADEGDSFWDRIVEAFTFDEDEDEEFSSLEAYGVRERNADRFNEALQDDEIVLLVDSAAPRNIEELSEVNENVLENTNEAEFKEDVSSDTGQSVEFHSTSELNENIQNQGGVVQMTNTEKERTQNIDEVGSEEAEAVKNKQENNGKKPSDVSTSETNNQAMEDMTDPSQAQNTREDGEVDEQTNSKPSRTVESGEEGEFDAETTEDEGASLETTPELTGDEDTVERDESDHRYPDNVAKGTVDGKNNDK